MDGWSVRIIAGLTLTLAGAALGRVLADLKKKRAEQLKNLREAVDRLALAMLERGMPLETALAGTGHEAFIAVSSLLKSERSAEKAWKSALNALRGKSGALNALEDEDISVLNELFASLGLSRAAEQRLLLDDCATALDALWQKARKKADEQGKLYSTLGLLAGLALAILLI